MGRKRGVYYVGVADMKHEIRKYQQSSKIPENRIASEELALMLIKIATKFSKRGNLIGYSYTDDFISLSVMRMLHNLDKIDLDYPNCNVFGYFSKVCERACKHIINKERVQSNIKQNVLDVYLEEFKDNGINIDVEYVGDDYIS